ncbi:hypothetical protein [Hyphococcus lacteus]|uniref:Uncharacterized protein n=1 Tax=Hyphococcus lacteus TaxID=3143536 RepID=A0ABV3Z5F9_9PROT
MIRLLAAVIIAVIVGFATAKFVESIGVGYTGLEVSVAYKGVLAFSWFIGAFVAALLALLIGHRWAPLGGLAASAIFLAAMIAMFSNPLGWLLWICAAALTGLGGYAAIKLTKASNIHPNLRPDESLFDE